IRFRRVGCGCARHVTFVEGIDELLDGRHQLGFRRLGARGRTDNTPNDGSKGQNAHPRLLLPASREWPNGTPAVPRVWMTGRTMSRFKPLVNTSATALQPLSERPGTLVRAGFPIWA